MKLIIITQPHFFEDETVLVNALFQQGLERLHLRKPQATREEMQQWIQQIKPDFHPLIVLHDHHNLALDYDIGGIHLNSRNPEPPSWVEELRQRKDFSLSRSCHTLQEILNYRKQCDYLFLSPIFDSISKEGYGPTWSIEQLLEASSQGIITPQVYALGGIAFNRLSEVRQLGFSRAAILGDLWRRCSTLNDVSSISFLFEIASKI